MEKPIWPEPKLITFELIKKQYFPEWGFRPETLCYPLDLGFSFVNGGMGDYITWMQPIRWLASEATWLSGTLIVPLYFKELADYWLKDFTHWRFKTYSEIDSIENKETMPMRGPLEMARESLNATGGHLLTCGWVYFTNKECAPPGWDSYPPFKQEDLQSIFKEFTEFTLEPKKYAVITTGITGNSRKTPPDAWNFIIEHVRERGLTPVFLGKSKVETGNRANLYTKFSDQTRYDLGVDLRDKTTLLQAAAIMNNAAVVIGHDNGLLHLAGCTEAPIVFGYNLASPQHREPRRPVGRVFNVTLTHAELACIHCQSNMNFVIGFNFKECFYGDLKCMSMLFEDGGRRWKEQIDKALSLPG